MSAATPLGFHDRARRYMAASGREWDPHRMSLDQVTPRQRRRLMHKERRSWRKRADQHRHDSWLDCDVCGLPDPYNGYGDGIGSCDCPRCECGSAAHSVFCTCPPDDYCDYYDDEAAVTEIERRFIGDLDGWKPEGIRN
jgi:hypothetical protein